ncbi:protein kinase domain-containing protein [Streptomyces sp. NBC_01506]|uniref:protein kinase domain-containing protein n=1 Tax=Streptomyces sp. NBC_01506 TaxID=2903887 RepID=UPI0038641701
MSQPATPTPSPTPTPTPTVTLTVASGRLDRTAYVFEERTTSVLGRSRECSPRLPDDEHHRTVSRHHCLLDINPPAIRVRDFGSLNGTYVNGRKIGQRAKDETPEEAAAQTHPEHDLTDGDEIRIGDTVLRVDIHAGDTVSRARCAKCAREVGHEVAGRPGDYLCAACQAQPAAMLRMLLDMARSGDSGHPEHSGHSQLDAIAGYTLLQELGRGGMGVVHLARHESSGKRVALKVMLPRVATRPEARERFLREVALTKALRHPNIAALEGSGFRGGVFFFTTEYCDGGGLDTLLRRSGGRLPVPEAVRLTRQALAGLAHAHSQGVVHRDLSPSNILLHKSADGSLTAKISDFGLAKAFDRAGLSGLTRTGEAAGKPWFMLARQVINFKDSRPGGDVWALAACLYTMLTGAHPRNFPRGEDPWRIVLESPAVPVRDRDPSVPRPLADVIDRALREKPDFGFPTAPELEQALQAAMPT